MADLERKQEEAAENGDLAGVKKATADIRALERETAACPPVARLPNRRSKKPSSSSAKRTPGMTRAGSNAIMPIAG
jgi:hypothetical protein